MLGEHVLAAAPIPENGLDRLSDGPLELETERGSLAVGIESQGEPILLEGELTGRREARLARITGELVEGERTIELDCPGVLHSREDAGRPAGLSRELTIVLSDGGLICVACARPPGVDRHSAEEAVAAISHPGGYIDFDQVLLSTEYDADGRQRRATLELWPASDEIAALHGAGSVDFRLHREGRRRPDQHRAVPVVARRPHRPRALRDPRREDPGRDPWSDAGGARREPDRDGDLGLRRRPDHSAGRVVHGDPGLGRDLPATLRPRRSAAPPRRRAGTRCSNSNADGSPTTSSRSRCRTSWSRSSATGPSSASSA